MPVYLVQHEQVIYPPPHCYRLNISRLYSRWGNRSDFVCSYFIGNKKIMTLIKILSKQLSAFTLVLLSVCTTTVFGQSEIDGYAIEYLQSAKSQSALYYGIQQEPLPRTTNHPYLKDMLFAKGRLSYNNILYPEVLLRFDLYRNELIATSPGYRDVVLFPESVDFAELHGQHIIYFRSDSLPGSPSTGYYFVLYEGNCAVLEKHTASLTSHSDSRMSDLQYYDFRKIFYLYKDGVYYTIRNKNSLLKVLQPYKKELKRYLSSQRLNYRQFPDVFIFMTISEYEKLSGQR